MKDNIGCITGIATLIVLLIFWPAIAYFTGWFAGLLLQWIIGDVVAHGLNYVFNTTRFTADMLPITCGIFSVIGSFFKSSTSTHSK